MMNRDDVVKFVRAELASSGELSGSDLSKRLRSRWPEWTPSAFGHRTLREFLAGHVPGVSQVGLKGLDPLYGVDNPAAQEQAAAGTQAPETSELWRVWASPNSPYALDVSADDGTLSAVERSAQPAPGAARLMPPDESDHRAIAKAFLSLQLPSAAAELEPVISGSAQWWQQWMKEVKKRDLSGTWGQFRFVRLLSHFQEQVATSTANEAARDKAVLQLRSTVKTHQPSSHDSSAGGAASLTELRQVAMLSIEAMDERQLRELKLPLGAVMDAIRRQRS